VFVALTDLQELSAPSNQLSGELPATLSRCRRLRVLNLRNNLFVEHIGSGTWCTVYLELGANSFTGSIRPASSRWMEEEEEGAYVPGSHRCRWTPLAPNVTGRDGMLLSVNVCIFEWYFT
jgi:hypothetical protein